MVVKRVQSLGSDAKSPSGWVIALEIRDDVSPVCIVIAPSMSIRGTEAGHIGGTLNRCE